MALDLETKTYERHRDQLLASSEGRYVLIAGDTVQGTFATHREAMSAGYQKFGLAPFMVKQVLAVEPIHYAAIR